MSTGENPGKFFGVAVVITTATAAAIYSSIPFHWCVSFPGAKC